MVNPWLNIPLDDYENHMTSDKVKQTQMINGVFADKLNKYNPSEIFVSGCTTGNGFEHISWSDVNKVYANDINPEFLKILSERFNGQSEKICLIKGNVEEVSLSKVSSDFVFTALLFEYVNVGLVLQKLSSILKPGGILSVILQLPSEKLNAISKTKYTSLETLGSIMKLVAPEEFSQSASDTGLNEEDSEVITLDSGKSFFIGDFRKV